MATTSRSPSARAEPRSLFRSLRARLVASHACVILLALALVLGISAGFLRRYELSAEKERLELIAQTVTIQADRLGRQNAQNRSTVVDSIVESLDDQAQVLGVRFLVLDRNARVIYDSDPSRALQREPLTPFEPLVRDLLQVASKGSGIQSEWIDVDQADEPLRDRLVLLSAGGPGRDRAALLIVAPERRYPLLGRFLRPLLLVTAISLGVASLAGLLLSRRIAAPVGRLTHAANAMAAGKLEQQVPGSGPDEIGGLVASFNAMSRQVAATARSQRDLLANVAHELRTPLTSVQGYAQALRDGVIEERAEQERALLTIGRESERMASLIGQLLDLSRLESGQTRLRFQPVAVETVLQRVAERFAREAATKSITLAAIGGGGLTIQGDEGRLIQIVSNLVSNAIRHTPEGGSVTVTAAPVLALGGRPGPGVRLTVADSGEGIAAERLPTIFDRFVRIEGSAGDRGGFGLGLPIVRELVAQHGGTVAVGSQPGVGTTFVVDLPAATAPAFRGQPRVAPTTTNGTVDHATAPTAGSPVSR